MPENRDPKLTLPRTAGASPLQRMVSGAIQKLESGTERLRRLQLGANNQPLPPGRDTQGEVKGNPESNRGRVQHDARGNAVWQWAVSTSASALESTSTLLRRLEAPELSLEGDQPLELESKHSGGNPYDRVGTVAKPRGGLPKAAEDPARAAALKKLLGR